MEDPKEITEARTYLEQAERESDPQRKIEQLKGGIELLEFYLEENPDASHEIAKYIRNLRTAHTRRLLSQLLSIKNIEIETWVEYYLLLITRLKDEVGYVTEQDPELKRNYYKFRDLWSAVAEEALKGYGK